MGRRPPDPRRRGEPRAHQCRHPQRDTRRRERPPASLHQPVQLHPVRSLRSAAQNQLARYQAELPALPRRDAPHGGAPTAGLVSMGQTSRWKEVVRVAADTAEHHRAKHLEPHGGRTGRERTGGSQRPDGGRYRGARWCAALLGGGESARGRLRSGRACPGRDGPAARCTAARSSAARRRPTRRSTTRTTVVARASRLAQVGELLPQRREETPLRLLTSFDRASLGGKSTSRCTWLASPLTSTSSHSKSVAGRAHDLFRPREVPVTEEAVPILRHEHHVRMQQERAVPDRGAGRSCRSAPYGARVQLQYAYRLDPTPGQRHRVGAGVRVRAGGVQRAVAARLGRP